MKLNANTILITGGSGGIGIEMARQLTDAGNKVIITGRNSERLSEAAAAISNLSTIQSDVNDPDQIKALANQVCLEYPDTNVVINNAGVMWNVNLQNHEQPSNKLTGEIDINLKGPILMVDAFLPHLKKAKNAAIVNVSSSLAFVPMPITPIYCATKAALHSYTLSLRAQLSNTNVKVFELMPPATETALMVDEFMESTVKGMSAMKTEKMVKIFVEGLGKNKFEIRPGQSNQLHFMSRLFPSFILKQMSKLV